MHHDRNVETERLSAKVPFKDAEMLLSSWQLLAELTKRWRSILENKMRTFVEGYSRFLVFSKLSHILGAHPLVSSHSKWMLKTFPAKCQRRIKRQRSGTKAKSEYLPCNSICAHRLGRTRRESKLNMHKELPEVGNEKNCEELRGTERNREEPRETALSWHVSWMIFVD